jgi:hypothetical protein
MILNLLLDRVMSCPWILLLSTISPVNEAFDPQKNNSKTKFSGLIELSLLYYVLKIRLVHQPPSWKNGGSIAL